MISIHDNEVQSYTIDLANKTIRLDTTWSYKERSERTAVEFRGVIAHHLVGANNWQNVLTSIEEKSLEAFISENNALLEEMKPCCWPCHYEDLDQLVQYLRKEEARYFQLWAAIGLDGWVLAQEMEYIALDDAPQVPYDHFDIY